jgi:hypothetical protein
MNGKTITIDCAVLQTNGKAKQTNHHYLLVSETSGKASKIPLRLLGINRLAINSVDKMIVANIG